MGPAHSRPAVVGNLVLAVVVDRILQVLAAVVHTPVAAAVLHILPEALHRNLHHNPVAVVAEDSHPVEVPRILAVAEVDFRPFRLEYRKTNQSSRGGV